MDVKGRKKCFSLFTFLPTLCRDLSGIDCGHGDLLGIITCSRRGDLLSRRGDLLLVIDRKRGDLFRVIIGSRRGEDLVG